ncbi:hypothetical protein B0H12DRAFT_1326094, partial [Mycena haematopus]
MAVLAGGIDIVGECSCTSPPCSLHAASPPAPYTLHPTRFSCAASQIDPRKPCPRPSLCAPSHLLPACCVPPTPRKPRPMTLPVFASLPVHRIPPTTASSSLCMGER